MTAGTTSDLDLARTVADAVLYEGYLLYPYRATSRKNQVRWQFGVLGPPGAADAGAGEESGLATECLLRGSDDAQVTVRLRFLQVQVRAAERADGGGFSPVDQLTVGATSWLTWDEAVEHELLLPTCHLGDLDTEVVLPVEVAGGEDVERLTAEDGSVAGRLVRRRWSLRGEVRLSRSVDSGVSRLRIAVDNVKTNTAAGAADPHHEAAVRSSFVGANLLVTAADAAFVSLLEPPPDLAEAADRCRQHRCWPVLAGPPGCTDIVLASPIILYDHPEVAEQSAGELFDSTEIDEILTLRVLTLTEEEKAQARATDPKAAQIIDRCEQMSPQQMQQLHGILRDVDPDPVGDDEVPWWDPAAEASVQPHHDVVMIGDVAVAGGSRVRIHPRRRADAQDLFFAGREARVRSVHFDVDGDTHVAVVLRDDPAADLHDWYGRYLYFAPEELEPLPPEPDTDKRGRRTPDEEAGQGHRGAADRRSRGRGDPRRAFGAGHQALPQDPPDVTLAPPGRDVPGRKGGQMTTKPGEHREEEPQDERGAPGSRDTGSDEPGGGPVDRPEGSSDEESDTSVNPQGSGDDAPEHQSGGG